MTPANRPKKFLLLRSMKWLIAGCLLAWASNAFAFTTVVIDPGHGGRDPGGIPGQRISEKTLALDVSRRLRDDLRAAGLHTVMTRGRDIFVPLPSRVKIANAQHHAIFLSVHFNSSPRDGACGFETYYYRKSALPIASKIQAHLVRLCPKEENRGVKPQRFYVLRNTRIPAVLAECGFLTNHAEGSRSLQASYRQRIADALAAGIEAAR